MPYLPPEIREAVLSALMAQRGPGQLEPRREDRPMAIPGIPGKTFSPIGAAPEDEQRLLQQARAVAPFGQSIRLPAPRTGGVLPKPTPLLAGPEGRTAQRGALAGLASALLGTNEPVGSFGPPAPPQTPQFGLAQQPAPPLPLSPTEALPPVAGPSLLDMPGGPESIGTDNGSPTFNIDRGPFNAPGVLTDPNYAGILEEIRTRRLA